MKTAFSPSIFLLCLWLVIAEVPGKITDHEKDRENDITVPVEEKVESVQRRRAKRSIMELNEMVQAVIGRSGMDFVGYGNWCGPGGGGQPVDPIDTCCAIHDFCYNKIIFQKLCPNDENGILFETGYKWSTAKLSEEKKMAKCDENTNVCTKAACHCDTQIVNCFQENMDSYRDENLHNIGFENLLDLFFMKGR